MVGILRIFQAPIPETDHMAGIMMRGVHSSLMRSENLLTPFHSPLMRIENLLTPLTMGSDSYHKPVARLFDSQPGSREGTGSRIFSTSIISDVKSFLKVKDHCMG